MQPINWHDALLVFLPELILSTRYTIFYALAVLVLSLIGGLLVAVGRTSRYRVVRAPLIAYVEFVRGTPALIQLYYIFYVLPFLGLTFPAIVAGILALSLNYTAYLSEVFRAAIGSIPRVQAEAAECLGMSYWQLMRYVLLPQAARVALPPTANYVLTLFKDTSLLSLITIKELMFTGQILGSLTFQYFTIFTEVALIYFVICYPWAILSRWLEHNMKIERSSA